jgi:hypothetical protein
MTGEISPVSFLYINSVLLQRFAEMAFCIFLRWLNRQLLPFPPASLAFDDVYPAAKGLKQSEDGLVEFAHHDTRVCVWI